MLRIKTVFAVIASFVFFSTARATPTTFTLQNGVYGSGATMTGTVLIDTTTGQMLSADLTYTLGGSSVTFNQAFRAQHPIAAVYGVYFPLTEGEIDDGPGPGTVDAFNLLIPAQTLVGYTGSLLCTGSNYCGGGITSEYFGRANFVIDHGYSPGDDVLATGSLAPLAATPEPPALVLTCTGIAFCIMFTLGRFRRMQTEAMATLSESFR